MNALTKGLILSLTLILFSCNLPIKWEYHKTFGDFELRKYRYLVDDNGDTTRILGMLEEDVIHKNWFIRKDWVHLDLNNKPLFFCLKDTATIHKRLYPRKTWILFFDTTYVTCVYPKLQKVDNYMVLGEGGMGGVQTAFYPDGELRSFFPVQDIEINGVPCEGGTFYFVELHPNGQLKQCFLSADKKIDGDLYPKGSHLYFNEKGAVENAIYAN